MTRSYCKQCQYPSKTCICESISPVNSHIQFHILQHPTEAKVAKNTARLLQLCHADTTIWHGEKPEDFDALQQELANTPKHKILLYPTETAIPLNEYRLPLDGSTFTTPNNITVLLIDGTWKKAYKIKQLNPWLNAYTCVHISHTESEYIIRKAKRPDFLSTIEAAEKCINQLDPHANTRPLQRALKALQANYLDRAGKNYT